jgi:hypothetical protein
MAKEKKQAKQLKKGEDIAKILTSKIKIKHPPKRRSKSRSEFSKACREWSKITDPTLRELSISIFFFGRTKGKES